ncbi:MAG: mechanosensitive ion channel family protein [Acidobacteriota bacterium]
MTANLPLSRLRRCVAFGVLAAFALSPKVGAQEKASQVDKVQSDVTKTLEEAASATNEFDRVKRYTSIRVPDEMIQIAPAEEHTDLVVRNRFITRFRAEVLKNPPKARARAANKVLSDLADKGQISPVESFPLEQGMLFVVANQPVFAVTYQDLDLISGETLQARTTEVVSNLELALSEMVELRDPQQLIDGLVKSGVALLLFLGVVWALQRLKRWLERRFLPTFEGRLQDSLSKRIRSGAEHGLRFIHRLQAVLVGLLWGVFLLAAYAWLTFSLEQFPYTRPWGETLGQTLIDLLAWIAVGIAQALPGLFVVLLVLFLARAGSRLVRAIFDAVEGNRLELPGVHPETAPPTRRLINTAIWLVAIVVAYPYFPGSSTAAFKGLSVFMGLVISLGSTGIVNQAMSGLMLMYSRALRPGDFVRIGEVQGTVTTLGMLSTKIRSLRNEEVTVPNAVVISRETTNFTRYEREGVGVSTTLTIGYDTPWRTVHSLLTNAADLTEGLRKDPEPFVLQTALTDFYPEYKLIAVIDHPEKRGRVLSQLHQNIQDLFHKQGIQIMSPHYEMDPPEPKIGSTAGD